MTLRILLACLFAFALLAQGGLRAAPQLPDTQMVQLDAQLGAPLPASANPESWPAAELPGGAEALSEPAGGPLGEPPFSADERGMEAPGAGPARRPAEAPRTGIERPPRA